jgi:hypothetical protein
MSLVAHVTKERDTDQEVGAELLAQVTPKASASQLVPSALADGARLH